MTDREIETRRQKAKARRYKKPIVNHLNLEYIKEYLEEIQEACEEVRWFEETEDMGLIEELIGGEEEAAEFKLMFFTLGADCDRMISDLYENWIPETFDLFFVAAGGGDDFGGMFGFDSYEGDYFPLESYEDSFAIEEASKKLMTMTKKDIVDDARRCFKIFSSYIGLANRYEDLKASIDIIRGKNAGQMKVASEINKLYDEAEQDGFMELNSKFDNLVKALPKDVWL